MFSRLMLAVVAMTSTMVGSVSASPVGQAVGVGAAYTAVASTVLVNPDFPRFVVNGNCLINGIPNPASYTAIIVGETNATAYDGGNVGYIFGWMRCVLYDGTFLRRIVDVTITGLPNPPNPRVEIVSFGPFYHLPRVCVSGAVTYGGTVYLLPAVCSTALAKST